MDIEQKQLVVLRVVTPVSAEQLENIQQMVETQLSKHPQFIVLPNHIEVAFMQPGDVLRIKEVSQL